VLGERDPAEVVRRALNPSLPYVKRKEARVALASLVAEVERLREENEGLRERIKADTLGARYGAELMVRDARAQGGRVAVRLWKLVDGYRELLRDAEWEIANLRAGRRYEPLPLREGEEA
jgi:hypothetical protein